MPYPANALLKSVAVIASFGLAAVAAAADESQVVPIRPSQFEPLHLRTTLDSCTFDASTVNVELRDHLIVASFRPRLCIVPGPPAVVDIELGAYPAGEYEVQLYLKGYREPLLRLPFDVAARTLDPGEEDRPFPVADYSGLWGNSLEPGWGLTLEQGATDQVFGALYVFDDTRQPQWYTLQAGQWQTSTRWSGQVVKSEGPPWAGPSYPADGAQYSGVGTATIDFAMKPGQEDQARFTYTIGGRSVTKTVTRFRLN
ncbi:hypothetical protein [Tahibacter caeni]|uniref:hypothetical protein n=1 Tax=Tahibacter caeni TaxID=1453545 RepID=UPI0021485CCB|nr:hypothetical protein [Tahibacter caeni]